MPCGYKVNKNFKRRIIYLIQKKPKEFILRETAQEEHKSILILNRL